MAGTHRKEAKEILLAHLTKWNTGLLPSQWKQETIIPILKKDKGLQDITNYRDLSLSLSLSQGWSQNPLWEWWLEVWTTTLKPASFLQANKQDLDSTVQHSNMWQCSVRTLKMLFYKGNTLNAEVFFTLDLPMIWF